MQECNAEAGGALPPPRPMRAALLTPRKLGRRGFKLGEGGQCRCAYGDGAAARGLAVLCDEATPSSEGMAAAEGKQLVPRGALRLAAYARGWRRVVRTPTCGVGPSWEPRLSAGKHSIDRSGISSSESPAASGRVPCKAARPSRTRGARGGRTKESTLESHPAAAPLAEEACEDADGASSTACRSAAARSSTLGKSIGVGRRSVDQRRAMCRTSSACSACSGASPPRESKSCCVRGVATRREPARRLGLRPKYACVGVERPGVGRSCGAHTEVGIVARLEHARRVDRGHRDGKARGREWCHARLNEVEEVLEPHQARPSEIGRWIVTLKAEQAPPR